MKKRARESKEEKKEKKKKKPRKFLIYSDYDAFVTRWKETRYATAFQELATHGYCVIPNVLDAKEVEQLKGEMWDWAELWRSGTCGPLRTDPSTWTAGHFPPGSIHGILQKWRIGHTSFAWYVRSHPAVMDVFATLWGVETKELEPSYDAANLGYPAKSKPKEWFHTDQSDKRLGLTQVQGLVALTPQGPESKHGALVVRRGSHLAHAAFFSATGQRAPSDWYQHSPEELKTHFPLEKYPEVHVEAPPGSLVLWDSRLLHYGRQPYFSSSTAAVGEAKTEVKKEVKIEPRFVLYVCLKHRRNMTAKQKQKKRAWLEALRMTSHSPDEGRVFGTSIRMYSNVADMFKRRIAAFEKAATARPDLVFPDAAAIRRFLDSRGAASLLCPP